MVLKANKFLSVIFGTVNSVCMSAMLFALMFTVTAV